jgi:transcriptional accessory protein Tex/SPT6
LEQYIDIPLVDLNTADSTALDDLPGIGGWYTSKIIEYRNSLGGYSSKEQLMEIYRFDQQKYDALADLVTISEPYVYPLWTLPADSLRKHPYIRNYETAKAIVMFREHNPPDSWTVENLRTAGIISPESARRMAVCVQPPKIIRN